MKASGLIAAALASTASAAFLCDFSYVATTCSPSSGFVLGLQPGAQVVVPVSQVDGSTAIVTELFPLPTANYVFPTYRATLNGSTWSFAIPEFSSTCIENENHVAELYSFPRFVPIGDFGTDLNITEVATVPAPKCPSCVSGPSCTVTLKLGACV